MLTSKQIKKSYLGTEIFLVLTHLFLVPETYFTLKEVGSDAHVHMIVVCISYSYFLMKCYGEGVYKINSMHLIHVHESASNTG